MAYSDLPLEYQNVILEHHSYILKWFVFLFLVFLACYYLLVSWKNHKPTKFYTIFAFRLLFLALSVGYLVAVPFTLLSMSPEYNFLDFYGFYLIIYQIILWLAGLMLLVDFLRYGFTGALKLGGLNIGDDNVNEIVRTLENNKHFMKFVGRGKKK